MSLLLKKRVKQTVENTPTEIVTFGEGVSLEIYGMANPLYQQAVMKLEGKLAEEDLLELNEQSPTIETQIAIVGKYLVKDWQGVVDEETGEEIEYTADAFIDAVVIEPKLLSFVIENSVRIQIEFNQKAEDTKKKSSKGTIGKKSTVN